jgi:hypothetical protein
VKIALRQPNEFVVAVPRFCLMEVQDVSRQKPKQTNQKTARIASKKAKRRPRHKARRLSEAVIHQNVLTDEKLAYL